jgi:hypothetical protein
MMASAAFLFALLAGVSVTAYTGFCGLRRPAFIQLWVPPSSPALPSS